MGNLERKNLMSRRALLKLAGITAVGAATYGLWKVNSDYQEREVLSKMNRWEPQVASLLNETLESERLDNLNILSNIARPQFVDMVSKDQNSLLSPDSNSKNNSRGNFLTFVLGEHYQLKIPAYEENPYAVLKAADSLSFLERALERVGYDKLKKANLQNQANMWVEALYRSYAAAWELDPTMNDGVYIPENQSLYGQVFAPRHRFVRLQPHSQ